MTDPLQQKKKILFGDDIDAALKSVLDRYYMRKTSIAAIHSMVSGQETNYLTNLSGSTRFAGDVVVFDTSGDTSYTTTTTASDIRVCGVVKDTTANLAVGAVFTGAGQVVAINVDTAAVARGQFLVSSATAGLGTAGSAYREEGVFAVALSSKGAGSNGVVSAMLVDHFRMATSLKIAEADPTPHNGLMYFNFIDNTIKFCYDSAWVTLHTIAGNYLLLQDESYLLLQDGYKLSCN